MALMALLGSQGIVVKCTAAIFFRMVDSVCYSLKRRKAYLKASLFCCLKWAIGSGFLFYLAPGIPSVVGNKL